MNLQQAKALFFAQYLWQQVYMSDKIKDFETQVAMVTYLVPSLIDQHEPEFVKQGVLLLRSVNQLTDEEIINIADMYGWGNKEISKDIRDERLLQFKIDLPYICIPGYSHRHMKFIFDYLLRIGILLPFTYLNEQNKPITLQPDEIITLGWAKINNL